MTKTITSVLEKIIEITELKEIDNGRNSQKTTWKNNVEKTKRLLLAAIPRITDKKTCNCNEALKNAFL